MFVFGVYDLVNGSCEIEHEGAKCLQCGDLSVWVLNTTQNHIEQQIADRFIENRRICVDEMYLALAYDRREKTLNIFADITSSPLNLYYTTNGDRVYFSTSLKKVLRESGIERNLDRCAAKAFLANGYIVGSSTLVERVNKLTFGHEIVMRQGAVSQVKYVPQETEKLSAKQAKKSLISTMEKSIENSLDAAGMIAMPLSNGYDSNMILNTVRKCRDEKIHAFTVGSRHGTNETAAVAENVRDLKVELHTELIDERYFDYFADIVWRLDGCVYESGVFLQYALANMVSRAGVSYLLCGEGSDEVQSIHYRPSLARVLDGAATRDKRYYTYCDPFIGTHLMVMKKSSVMLNSFGVVGRYPFKSTSVEAVAAGAAKANGTQKKYYKKKCRELFPAQIAGNLKTRGGTTGVRTVISSEQLEQLKKLMEDNEWLRWISSADNEIVTDVYTQKLRRQQGRKRIISEIRDNGLVGGVRAIIRNRKNRPLVKLFKQAYLVLFRELFLSGKYDDSFENAGAPVKTGELLFG